MDREPGARSPEEEEAAKGFVAPETGGVTTDFDTMQQQMLGRETGAVAGTEAPAETPLVSPADRDRPAWADESGRIGGDNPTKDELSKAEAMARAGNKAETQAARERALASGAAKETLRERAARRFMQTTEGASVDLAPHGGYGLHEGADREYHGYFGEVKQGEADRKEEKAGEKWEQQHKKAA